MKATNSNNYISIRPNCISLYSLPEKRSKKTVAQKLNEKNLKNNSTSGLISYKANKRVRDAMNWLIYFSDEKSYYNRKQKKRIKFRLSFTTLTLSSPQSVSDNQIKSLFLNQILTQLRTDYQVKHYFWRAEAQINGNIHFHIVCDKFIPWSELRNKWNNIQNKLGYIDSFKEHHKHKNPNSVDVHEVSNIKNLPAYLAEYCTKQTKGALYTPCKWQNGKLVEAKNPENWQLEDTPYYVKNAVGKKIKRHSVRIIFGKQWGLSQSLSQVKAASYIRDAWLDAEIRKIRSAFAGKVFVNDYVTSIYVSVKDWSKIIKGYLYKLFINYLKFHKHKIAIPLQKLNVSIVGNSPPPKPIPITVATTNWSNLYTQKSLNF